MTDPHWTPAALRAYVANLDKATVDRMDPRDLAALMQSVGALPPSSTGRPSADICPDGEESAFLASAQAWLLTRGYWPRSKVLCERDEEPPRGWQLHVRVSRGNPYTLDLLLLGNDGRWLEVELKTEHVKWHSVAQQCLARRRWSRTVRSLRDLDAVVTAWQNEGSKEGGAG